MCLPSEKSIQCSTDVLVELKNHDTLSVLPDDIQFTVLFGPDKDQKDLLKTRMSEMTHGKSFLIKC